jgi:putative peptidoglycan lipid II flippase
MSKFFTKSGAAKATALISLTSFLSYVIGFLRDKILAYYFGTSIQTDIYNAAFVIPDAVFNMFIASALTAAFLPVFTEYLKKDKEEAFKIANTMLTVSTIFVASISALLFFFMDEITPLIFSSDEMNAATLQNISTMTKLLLPLPLIFAISNTLGNILMSYKHFFSYSISPILYNLGIITGILIFHKEYGIYSAATGAVIGAIFHCLIRIIDMFHTEFRPVKSLNIKLKGFKEILTLMIPRSFSLIASSINTVIYASIGTKILIGSFAAYNFARNIQSFAVSLFGIAFSTAIFPFLTASLSENDKESFTKDIQKTIQRILFFTVPSMTGMMILAPEIISLLLGGGQFDENSINLTSGILFFFAISIPFESLTHILTRSFYALKNTLTPMYINLISIAINIIITLKIATKYGVNWFSLGFTISFIVQVLLLAIFLKKHLTTFDSKKFIKYLLKLSATCVLMALSIFFIKIINLSIDSTSKILIELVVGGASFFIYSYFMKMEELKSLNIVISKILKK